MYVGAALSLMAVPIMSHYIAGLNDIVDELRYQAVLVFIVVVCCYCFVMANMVKYNVMKKKVAVLEDTVEKLEQEHAAAMSQAVDEEQQHKVQEALDWFAITSLLSTLSIANLISFTAAFVLGRNALVKFTTGVLATEAVKRATNLPSSQAVVFLNSLSQAGRATVTGIVTVLIVLTAVPDF